MEGQGGAGRHGPTILTVLSPHAKHAVPWRHTYCIKDNSKYRRRPSCGHNEVATVVTVVPPMAARPNRHNWATSCWPNDGVGLANNCGHKWRVLLAEYCIDPGGQYSMAKRTSLCGGICWPQGGSTNTEPHKDSPAWDLVPPLNVACVCYADTQTLRVCHIWWWPKSQGLNSVYCNDPRGHYNTRNLVSSRRPTCVGP